MISQYFQYLVFLGITANLVGVIPYIRETLRGNTKPNRITWLMWFVAPLIVTLAEISDGVVGLAVLPVFISGAIPLMVFISSFANKKSYWKLRKFDYFCGLCSVLALLFWYMTKDPLIAIIFSLVSDIFASIPTMVKAWKYPETETGITFVAGAFSALTSFFAIKTWTPSSYLFPAYLVVACSLSAFFVYRKKIKKGMQNFIER